MCVYTVMYVHMTLICLCISRKQVGDDGANSTGHSRLQSQESLRQGAIVIYVLVIA